MASPLVSVIMPVYNSEAHLREAIESILNQSYQDFEFILINDGSIDKSEAIIQSYRDDRIVYVKNEYNLGISRTRNKALRLAKGFYIVMADSDDISLPTRIEIQLNFLQKNPEIDILGGQLLLINSTGKEGGTWNYPISSEQIQKAILKSCCIAQPTVMIKRQVLVSVNGYSTLNMVGEDYHLWLRLTKNHLAYNLPELLVKYRIHAANISRKKLINACLFSLALKHVIEFKNSDIIDKNFLLNHGISMQEIDQEIIAMYSFWAETYLMFKDYDVALSVIREMIIYIDDLQNYTFQKCLYTIKMKLYFYKGDISNALNFLAKRIFLILK